MTNLSSAAQNINWLIGNFVNQVPGVKDAVVVSADGLPMAVSDGLDRDAADRFAAVASGLIGLAYGAAGRFGAGGVSVRSPSFFHVDGQLSPTFLLMNTFAFTFRSSSSILRPRL